MKRNSILIAIFVITTIIASCLAVFFGIKSNSQRSDLESKIENLNSQISSLKSENNTVDNTEQASNDTNNSNNTQEKVEEKIVYKYERPVIDTNKCLNPIDGSKYSVSRGIEYNYLDCSCEIISNGKAKLTFNNISSLEDKGFVINNNIKEKSVLDSFSTEITNFSSDVIDAYFGHMGHGIGKESILFIMKDGSVEYIPIKDALENNTIKSYGKILDVNGVVEIINGSSARKWWTEISQFLQLDKMVAFMTFILYY